jgi:hypothetical protein
VAWHVLVDPLDGRGALRDGRDDDPRGPPGPPEPAGGEAGGPGRGRPRVAPGAFRRAPLKPAAAFLAAILILLASSLPLPAEKPPAISKLDPSPALEELLARIARETVAEFSGAGLTEDGISIAVIDLTAPTPCRRFGGAYRGDFSYYPARS